MSKKKIGVVTVFIGHPLQRSGTQSRKRFRPHLQRAMTALLHDRSFRLSSDTEHIAIVTKIKEEAARAFLLLTGQIWQQVVTIDVVRELLAIYRGAFLQPVHAIGITSDRQEGGQPIVVLYDSIGNGTSLDLARVAHQHRYAERALPVGVFLARKGVIAPSGQLFMCGPLSEEYITKVLSAMPSSSSRSSICPTFLSWSIIVSPIRRLPPASLSQAFRLGVSEQVHVSRIQPDKERLAVFVLALDQIGGRGDEFVVAGLHALFRQRPGVFDPLLADASPTRLFRGIVLIGRPAMQHTAGTELL